MRILLSLLAAVGVLAAGCGGSDGEGEKPKTKPEPELYYHEFPTVTASLSGTGKHRQVRVTFTFAIRPQDKDRAVQIIQRQTPELIDDLLLLLAEYDSNSMSDPKELDKLRAEVCEIVNKRANGAPIVQDVLFRNLHQL